MLLQNLLYISISLNCLILIWIIASNFKLKQKLLPNLDNQLQTLSGALSQHLSQELAKIKDAQQLQSNHLYETLLSAQSKQSESVSMLSQTIQANQETSIHKLQKAIGEQYVQQHKQLHEVLSHSSKHLNDRFNQLNQSTERHMLEISQSMQSHLTKGFEKTNETFTNIIKRLAIIDDAQKKITDLSQNVVDLQDILKDKRSRGAFGEMQLKTLIDNLLPSNTYAFQYTLSTGARADCVLFLPNPTGHIVIDAKFPLENYQKLTQFDEPGLNKTELTRLFKQDIKKHIQDIAAKYIIPEETAEGAVMFIPAEAVFAEIHAHHPDLVELSYQKKIWMASPTTLMAILTTAQSVIKDDLTRQQIHVIQKHLKLLAQDFSRFEKRMDNLSKHLQQANTDAEQVHTSAKKIAKKFSLIEQVELNDAQLKELLDDPKVGFSQTALTKTQDSDEDDQELSNEQEQH